LKDKNLIIDSVYKVFYANAFLLFWNGIFHKSGNGVYIIAIPYIGLCMEIVVLFFMCLYLQNTWKINIINKGKIIKFILLILLILPVLTSPGRLDEDATFNIVYLTLPFIVKGILNLLLHLSKDNAIYLVTAIVLTMGYFFYVYENAKGCFNKAKIKTLPYILNILVQLIMLTIGIIYKKEVNITAIPFVIIVLSMIVIYMEIKNEKNNKGDA